MILKEFVREKKRAVTNYPLRKRLKNKDFSIISNNCWGGQVYQDLGVEYLSPFAGLFFYAPCYIKLLNNLRHNMSLELIFVDESKYDEANKERISNPYPIGLLGDIEVHFLHYKSKEEAAEKWYRRSERINWDNLFVKFCDRDLCTLELLIEFDKLEFENKICFTSNDYKNIESNVWFSEYKNSPHVEDELKVYKKYFDVVQWLNNTK